MNNAHVYLKHKQHVIALRKAGKTYSEILAKIPVAKSTITLWLQDVHLAKKQKQRITAKKIAASIRGGLARKTDRINRTKIIHEVAKNEIFQISKRELWLIGIALYWAEGSKSKIHNPSLGIVFTNSDYEMVQVFLCWLKRCCGIKTEQFGYEIYIHESSKDRIQQVVRFWSEKLGISERCLQTIRYKKNKVKTKRKNVGDLYNGCFRVRVKASSTLNRKIMGWIDGIMGNL